MEELDFKAIGKHIKDRRIELGITQEALANALEVNPSHISNIETGRAHPSLTALVRIADFLHCSIDSFIYQEYSSNYSDTPDIDKRILKMLKFKTSTTKEQIFKIIEIL
jgi:transcriptional regulator with XRE-family HTH domain